MRSKHEGSEEIRVEESSKNMTSGGLQCEIVANATPQYIDKTIIYNCKCHSRKIKPATFGELFFQFQMNENSLQNKHTFNPPGSSETHVVTYETP